jgi:2-keto-4-pentenoate hydratase/2-oxohepta-3-ene-1,7-dioic acid hydratase in catechol pathway
MKLVSFSVAGGATRPGYLLEDTHEVVDLHSAGFQSTLDVITSPTAPELSGNRLPLAAVKLHAPLDNPPRIFCIGLNYRDHAIESKMDLPRFPVVFFKLTPSIIATNENIVIPTVTEQPDYEAEFAFVIGKGGYRISAKDALSHVYGYTIINDVSARDIQFSTSQWSLSKSLPTFCPMGPAIVTADEIADPHTLDIQLSINGEVLQHSNTRELIFNVPRLIEYLSTITPLLPGDIVSTGTPAGVGLGRTPKRWLRDGDTVTVSVQGLGQLVNPVRNEPS